MKSRSMLIALSLTLGLVVGSGCGNDEECTALAEHVGEVIAKEQGGELSAKNRKKMIKETAEHCASEKPTPEVIKCALAASSTSAMRACDTSVPDGE